MTRLHLYNKAVKQNTYWLGWSRRRERFRNGPFLTLSQRGFMIWEAETSTLWVRKSHKARARTTFTLTSCLWLKKARKAMHLWLQHRNCCQQACFFQRECMQIVIPMPSNSPGNHPLEDQCPATKLGKEAKHLKDLKDWFNSMIRIQASTSLSLHALLPLHTEK